MAVDPKTVQMLRELRGDFRAYSGKCLKVRDKLGNIVPFVWNNAQEILHEHVEEQLRTTSKVRTLVLKARQQGASTYIGGRFYHKTTMKRGVNTFILSHEQSSSDALFSIVNRYHSNNPIAPHTGSSNIRELEFDLLDSSYNVATAGGKPSGRGKTMSLFHGSEAAFWQNAQDHFAASVQTVPDAPGTEIILESTANGTSGEFYERWQDAVGQAGEYRACFIPWFVQTEYARPDLVVPGFELTDDKTYPNVKGEALYGEIEYAELFGVGLAQMAWRRNKIRELRDVGLFDQEYPALDMLAFQQKSKNAYQNAADVLRARKRKDVEPVGPLIIGVDPAGEGGDRFAMAHRRGYACTKVEWRDKVTHLEAVEWLKAVIDEDNPAVVFVDAGGIGQAIISGLASKGARYSSPHVRAVNFGSPSQAKKAYPKRPGPKNRRAEMALRVKEWLALEEGVSIPDMDVLQADLMETRIKPTLNNDLQLEAKAEIRARSARSPDLADALGLTFADLTHIANYSGPKIKNQFGAPDQNIIKPTYHETEFYGSGDGWMG